MMLDADIVAVSPASVWRVLGQAGLLSKWNGKPSKKGTGFEQPLAAHQHWRSIGADHYSFPYARTGSRSREANKGRHTSIQLSLTDSNLLI